MQRWRRGGVSVIPIINDRDIWNLEMELDGELADVSVRGNEQYASSLFSKMGILFGVPSL